MMLPDLQTRSAGILLHPTSLPAPAHSGDLGPSAHRFAEFLARAGQRWWQMLPIGPPGAGDSPYCTTSLFAGSPWLVSPEFLRDEGVIRSDEIPSSPELYVNYPRAYVERGKLLSLAFDRHRPRDDLDRFRSENAYWLEDFALFTALSEAHPGKSWTEWPEPLRKHRDSALQEARRTFADSIRRTEFAQWQFDRQWRRLRQECARLGIALLGDLPIYAAHESADVWANQELFLLDAGGRPTVVAGVPPDYFSKTGQLWGNPLYRWDEHRRQGFAWWIRRIRHSLERFDALRLDHFIGFCRYWEVPAKADTAVDGRWVDGPGEALFDAVFSTLGRAPLVAENLGCVTPEIESLRKRCGFLGMRVLQFEIPGDSSPIPEDNIVYTGTHDNETTRAWFDRLEGEQRERARQRGVGEEPHWDMIRIAYASPARIAIVPIQDLLGLGAEARMNTPGAPTGNWRWKLDESLLSDAIATRLRELARACHR